MALLHFLCHATATWAITCESRPVEIGSPSRSPWKIEVHLAHEPCGVWGVPRPPGVWELRSRSDAGAPAARGQCGRGNGCVEH